MKLHPMSTAPRDGRPIYIFLWEKKYRARYQPDPDARGLPGPHGAFVWKCRGNTRLADRAPDGWLPVSVTQKDCK